MRTRTSQRWRVSRPKPAPSAPTLEVDLAHWLGPGQYALRRLGAGLVGQSRPRHATDRNPGAGGQLLDLAQDRDRVDVVGQPHLAGPPAPRGQQLSHRLSALD